MMFKIISIILVIYMIYGIMLFSLQRDFLFPRRHIQIPHTSMNIAGIEKIWFETGSGNVEAWFIPLENKVSADKAPAVLFMHGNGEVIDYCAYEFLPYATMGLNVLLVEYPGYGRSEGKPSQKAITETVCIAYDWLLTVKNIDPEKVVVHGRSVGGGVACALVQERAIAAVILESTFTDTKQFARGFLLPGFLLLDRFDNKKVLESYTGPVLIIHGKHDELIPYHNSVSLAQAAKNSTLIAYDCHHNDCPPDSAAYWSDLRIFLKANRIIDYF